MSGAQPPEGTCMVGRIVVPVVHGLYTEHVIFYNIFLIKRQPLKGVCCDYVHENT